jgi:hypothetical protein
LGAEKHKIDCLHTLALRIATPCVKILDKLGADLTLMQPILTGIEPLERWIIKGIYFEKFISNNASFLTCLFCSQY